MSICLKLCSVYALILWQWINQPYDFSQIRQRNLYRIQTLLYVGQGFFAIMYIAVLWIRIRDSRSGTFLTPRSQTDIFESIVTIF
jgi:hypothetical protein